MEHIEREAMEFDVVIVGAGLSGIGAAYHLQKRLPGKTYAILEAREAIGGTWDLFRYPGIRSDSDMYTLGYNFKPWPGAKAIADGPSIREYVNETARENGIDKHIRFRHRVTSLAWSNADARWTVVANENGKPTEFTCGFVMMCSGYYKYEHGYTPDFAGLDKYKGKLIHPQLWPENLDYKGKNVVVIGSGATAVTIVPEMAKNGAHVTMLQRSPTYVVTMPSQDGIANFFRKLLPEKAAYMLSRWKNILRQMLSIGIRRHHPGHTPVRRQNMIEPIPQRRALALVGVLDVERDGTGLHEVRDGLGAPVGGPVVDDHHLGLHGHGDVEEPVERHPEGDLRGLARLHHPGDLPQPRQGRELRRRREVRVGHEQLSLPVDPGRRLVRAEG